jgi:hypothetical protein
MRGRDERKGRDESKDGEKRSPKLALLVVRHSYPLRQ